MGLVTLNARTGRYVIYPGATLRGMRSKHRPHQGKKEALKASFYTVGSFPSGQPRSAPIVCKF